MPLAYKTLRLGCNLLPFCKRIEKTLAFFSTYLPSFVLALRENWPASSKLLAAADGT
jgi:hypothetical protein